MNFSLSVSTEVDAAIASVLSCEAWPVKRSLLLLMSGQDAPIRALVACSLRFNPSAIKAGAALDIIYTGLQRLHARMESGREEASMLGTGAVVLVGDYLTSGAFRLLVDCADMRLLSVAASAVNQVSELEVAHLGMGQADVSPQCMQKLLAPLAIAAGDIGSILAGYPPDITRIARVFAEHLVASHILFLDAECAVSGQVRTSLYVAASNLCRHAIYAAEAIAAATENHRPRELAEGIAARIAARTSFLAEPTSM